MDSIWRESMQDRDRVYEEKRLKRTLEEIESQLKQMTAIEQAFVSNIRTTYRNMWEEVENAPNDLQDMDQLVQAKIYLDEMWNLGNNLQERGRKNSKAKENAEQPVLCKDRFSGRRGTGYRIDRYRYFKWFRNEEPLEILCI